MTPALRESHRRIWLILAAVLPIGFVAALQLNTVAPAQEPLINSLIMEPLPELVKSVEKPGLLANLRRDRQSAGLQLEIIVRQPRQVPSVVVRVGAGKLAVGTLNVAGIYRFALPDSMAHPIVTLVDEVHQSTLQTIYF